MSMDNNQDVQDKSEQAKRRRIIKGLASLPAMATLASGAAQAATSSQCLQSPPPINLNVPVGTPTRDCVDVGTTTMIPGADLSDPLFHTDDLSAIRAPYTGSETSGAEMHCVEYVSPVDGTRLGTDPGSGGISATASCYTSFAP